MYLRLRKRRKPLPTETAAQTATEAGMGIEPLLGSDDAPAPPTSDWAPAEPEAQGSTGTDVSTPHHPNRGNARESSRGSHR